MTTIPAQAASEISPTIVHPPIRTSHFRSGLVDLVTGNADRQVWLVPVQVATEVVHLVHVIEGNGNIARRVASGPACDGYLPRLVQHVSTGAVHGPDVAEQRRGRRFDFACVRGDGPRGRLQDCHAGYDQRAGTHGLAGSLFHGHSPR
jgi:hypothetical protein